MKTKILVLLTFLSTGMYAQFNFGIKAGIGSSNVSFTDLQSNTNVENLSAKEALGYHAGLFARVKVLSFYVQPEMLFTALNSNIDIQNFNGDISTVKFNLSRLDVPVLVGFKMMAFSVYGGPVMSYNMTRPAEIISVDYRNGSLGYQAGVGLTFGDFLLDLKYEGSFQNFANSVVIDGTEYTVDARTGQVILSLGYAL